MLKVTPLILALFLIASAVGCASPTATLNKGQQASGKIEARIDSARESAVKIQKLVSGNLAGYVDDIIDDLTAAQTELPPIRAALAAGQKAQENLDNERTWWISYRVHRDFKWTVAGVVVLLVLLLALWVLSQVAGPVGMVAAPIFHTLTGGLVLAGKSISNAMKKQHVNITFGPGSKAAPISQ